MEQRRKRRKRRQKNTFALKSKKLLIVLVCIVFVLLLCGGISYYFVNEKAGKHVFAPIKQDQPNNGQQDLVPGKKDEIVDNGQQDLAPGKKDGSVVTGTSQNLNSIKVGFWNILNYDDNPTKIAKKFQQENLAKVIKHLNPDVIGLVEVNSGDAKKPNSVENLTKKLNELDNTQIYTSITSDPVFGDGNEASTERVSFIYKKSVIEILEINKDKLYGSNPYLITYDNPVFNSVPAYFPDGKVDSKGELIYPKTKTTKNVDFARPPVGGKFKIKKNNQEFVLVASHFDAPGANKGGYTKGKEEGKIDPKDGFDSSNGSQEISEANHLLDTMEFFKNKTNTDNLFFMGDTNIKAKSHDKAFERLLTSYKSLISKENNTSLGINFGSYSNSYDKIFQSKSSSLITENANKYPLWEVIKDNIVTKQALEDTYKQKQSEDRKPIKDTDLQEIENKVRDYISDHSPVYFEIALN